VGGRPSCRLEPFLSYNKDKKDGGLKKEGLKQKFTERLKRAEVAEGHNKTGSFISSGTILWANQRRKSWEDG